MDCMPYIVTMIVTLLECHKGNRFFMTEVAYDLAPPVTLMVGHKHIRHLHFNKSFNTKDGRQRGFETYGFGTSTCKRARKKLTALGLIEIKPGTIERGLWPVTMYKINPQLMSTGDHSGLRSKTTVNSGPGPP